MQSYLPWKCLNVLKLILKFLRIFFHILKIANFSGSLKSIFPKIPSGIPCFHTAWSTKQSYLQSAENFEDTKNTCICILASAEATNWPRSLVMAEAFYLYYWSSNITKVHITKKIYIFIHKKWMFWIFNISKYQQRHWIL